MARGEPAARGGWRERRACTACNLADARPGQPPEAALSLAGSAPDRAQFVFRHNVPDAGCTIFIFT